MLAWFVGLLVVIAMLFLAMFLVGFTGGSSHGTAAGIYFVVGGIAYQLSDYVEERLK